MIRRDRDAKPRADEVILEPALASEEEPPPVDAGGQEAPSGGGDGEAPGWEPVIAREAEAEPSAAVEAVENVPARP